MMQFRKGGQLAREDDFQYGNKMVDLVKSFVYFGLFRIIKVSQRRANKQPNASPTDRETD